MEEIKSGNTNIINAIFNAFKNESDVCDSVAKLRELLLACPRDCSDCSNCSDTSCFNFC